MAKGSCGDKAWALRAPTWTAIARSFYELAKKLPPLPFGKFAGVSALLALTESLRGRSGRPAGPGLRRHPRTLVQALNIGGRLACMPERSRQDLLIEFRVEGSFLFMEVRKLAPDEGIRR